MNDFVLPPLDTITAANATRIKEVMRIGDGRPRDVAYSPCGKYLAVGSSIGIWLYDAQSHARLKLIGQYQSGMKVVFSPDGKLIASVAKSKTISVWDVLSGEQVSAFAHEDDHLYVQDLAFHPTQNLIASGDWHSVNVWEVDTGKLLFKIPNTGNVSCVQFSPEGQNIGIGNSHGGCFWWDWDNSTLRKLPSLSNRAGSQVYRVAFISETKMICAMDSIITVWDISANTEKWRIETEDNSLLYGMELLPKTNKVALSYRRGGLRVLDLNSHIENVIDDRSGIALAVSVDGPRLAYIAYDFEYAVDIYDVNPQTRHTLRSDEPVSFGLAVSPDSTSIAYGMSHNAIQVLDLKTSNRSKQLDRENFWDNQWIGSNLLDAESLEQIVERSILQSSSIYRAAINRDRTLVAGGGSHSHTAVGSLLDVNTSELLLSFETVKYYGAEMSQVQFSPDGALVVYADTDGDIYVWDVKKKAQVAILTNHFYILDDMIFSPDGRFLATLGVFDETVRIWGVPSS